MKPLLFCLMLSFLPLSLGASVAACSWSFNDDGGFGFYRPEGWTVRRDGRSSRLIGPVTDVARSEIFIASDWSGHVSGLESLREHLIRETGAAQARPTRISGLDGFTVGDERTGITYVLRSARNFIVLRFALRGSEAQIEEGKLALSSVEIKTKGIEY